MQYEQNFKKEIVPLISPRIEADLKQLQLPQFIRFIYWREFQEDQHRKKFSKKEKTISTTQLNSFILKIISGKNKLQNSGNLEEAEFLYRNWKLTDANNANAKIFAIGERKGKYKYEIMRRICAIANAGGGILFWGVNEQTNRVEGIKLNKE